MGVFMGYVIHASDSGSLNGIRQLISVYLTPQDLPDSIIDSPIFLEAAERQVYQALGIADNAAYLTRAGLPDDFPNFPRNQFPVTFNYRQDWCQSASYSINDIISFRSDPANPKDLYIATADNSNIQPDSGSANWNKLSIVFKGDYQYRGSYQQNDIVYYRNTSNLNPIPSGLYYANKDISSAPGTLSTSDWKEIQSVTQTPAQKAFEERVKRAVQYQAAIRLIPAVPQILEEQILRERVRYQSIDWEQRLSVYQTETDDTLQPEEPAIVYASGTAVFGEVKQYVAF